MVVAGFLRIATSRKIFVAPMSIDESTMFVEAVLAMDATLAAHKSHWLARETIGYLRRTFSRLDVTFARIWTLGPGEDVLVLAASAGLYTHTDGPHARSSSPIPAAQPGSFGLAA